MFLPVRFGLTYIGADTKNTFPWLIHASPFVSDERFAAC